MNRQIWFLAKKVANLSIKPVILIFVCLLIFFTRVIDYKNKPPEKLSRIFQRNEVFTLSTEESSAIIKNLTHKLSLGRFLECSPDDEIVVYVHSSSWERERRIVIRNTWASKRLSDFTKARVFFVIGKDRENSKELKKSLIWEQDIFNDLIQGEFIENPLGWNEAMTRAFSDLKSILWIKRSSHQCAEVPFILKVNSDTFVDLILLREQLNLLQSLTANDDAISEFSLICNHNYFRCTDDNYLLSNWTQERLLNNLWFTPNVPNTIRLTSNFISLYLAEEAALTLKSFGEFFNTDDKVSHFMETGIEKDDSFNEKWNEMLQNHNMHPKPMPVFFTNFTTTSHKRYQLNNPSFCKSWPGLETLIVVHSNPIQGDFRQKIRETWADSRIYSLVNCRPLFFLGRSPDPFVEMNVQQESQLFGDIIQTDFLDTYMNLTFKAISWMQWVRDYCPGVKNLVKSDDDMVIDVFKLRSYLDKVNIHFDMTKHRNFHCYHWKYGRINRNPNHKHYISKSLYSKRLFPAYCSGSAFILSPHISNILLNDFENNPSFIWIDDVFITGILAKRAGIGHQPLNSVYVLTKKEQENPKLWERFIFAHVSGRNNHDFRKSLWKKILDRHKIRLLGDSVAVEDE